MKNDKKFLFFFSIICLDCISYQQRNIFLFLLCLKPRVYGNNKILRGGNVVNWDSLKLISIQLIVDLDKGNIAFDRKNWIENLNDPPKTDLINHKSHKKHIFFLCLILPHIMFYFSVYTFSFLSKTCGDSYVLSIYLLLYYSVCWLLLILRHTELNNENYYFLY